VHFTVWPSCGNRVAQLFLTFLLQAEERAEQQDLTMDVSRVGAGHVPVKAAVHQVVKLDSDDESEIEDALLGQPRVNGVNGVNGGFEALEAPSESADDEDGDNDEWEVESLFEDTLEELGDESLFDGSGLSETPLSGTC
jgi:hypothetical protein